MQLTPMTMFIFMLVCVVAYAAYSARSLKDRILCTVNRRDRTKIVRWAKQNQARIAIDGGWYDVDPACTVLRLWDSGIHWFFPVWIRCSDYRHDSSKPLNPDTFDNQYTPEARKQLDKTDDIRALEQGNQQALTAKGGRQGMLQQYLPLIVLVGFLIVGWLLWQQRATSDKLGFAMNVIQEQLGRLLQR